MTYVLPAPPDRFALIIGELRRALKGRAATQQAVGPLLSPLFNWLGRLVQKFAALAARVQAGTLPPPRHRTARLRPPGPPDRPPKIRFSRQYAWLVRLVGSEAACFGSQLQHLLADPEMEALLNASPQAGRLFRPLCRMLAAEIPPYLRLPPRPPRPTQTQAGQAAARLAQGARPPRPLAERHAEAGGSAAAWLCLEEVARHLDDRTGAPGGADPGNTGPQKTGLSDSGPRMPT